VAAAEENLTIALGVGFVDTELTTLYDLAAGASAVEAGPRDSLGTAILTHAIDFKHGDVELEEILQGILADGCCGSGLKMATVESNSLTAVLKTILLASHQLGLHRLP